MRRMTDLQPPRTRRLRPFFAGLACATVAFALLCGGASAADAPTQKIQAWAYPAAPAPIRAAPSTTARTISRLHFTTELGDAEVYEASARIDNADGGAWLRIAVLGRPNGRFGWVPASALGPLHQTNDLLVISRSKLKATLHRGGRVIWHTRVGIGKASTPTPGGHFYIREALSVGASNGVFGAFAFGTSAYSPGLSDWPAGGVIGIHGTNQPNLLPGRISHGCIRMRNAAILRLRRLIKVGTPLQIR
jgi:hypothetical protein